MKIPPPPPHSCLHNGHVWLEADGSLYSRHRNRQGTVPAACLYCDVVQDLPAFGKATMPFHQEVVKAVAELRKDSVVRAKIDATKAAFALATAKEPT